MELNPQGGGWGLFNLDNPIIPSSLWEEYIPLDGGIIGVKGDNKRWGLVTDEGKKITHCLWSSIRSSKRWSSYVMVQDTNNLWGYIDITGKVISKCLWKDVRNFSDEDMAPVQGDNGNGDS